jgi:hypothetical protein
MENKISKGLCQCGCGQKTLIATTSDKRFERTKGQPLRFIKGHQSRGQLMHKWNNGRTNDRKYPMVTVKGHPRATRDGYVRESIVIAEKALGKFLPPPGMVHHVDGNPANSSPSNLVICQDDAYHKLLHCRARAYEACGHADWKKCWICKKYDDPANLYINPANNQSLHRSCGARIKREKNKKGGNENV